jgi:alpha-L-fucosidase
VAYSGWRGGKGDVVAEFVRSVTKAGLGAGYYYSLGRQLEKSLMTGPHNLTKAQVRAVEQQQLAELWTTYGNNGNLSEVW